MDSTVNTRRPCFIEENIGLASLADMETGSSGSNNYNNDQVNHLLSRPMYYSRKTSLRKLSLSSSCNSPRSGRFLDSRFEEHQPHFLDACFLCKKQLGDNKDIFMYRGDTPFCSEECRQEQIDIDEAKEKKWNLKALRNKTDQNKSTNTSTKKNYSFRTGAVAELAAA